MREIKFRAWDKVNNRWFYFNLADTARIGFYEKIKLLKINLDEANQFTGLHDQVGKEVYEGDIVNFCNNIGEVRFRKHTKAEFYLYGKDQDYELINNYNLNVLGNIYENPELLK